MKALSVISALLVSSSLLNILPAKADQGIKESAFAMTVSPYAPSTSTHSDMVALGYEVCGNFDKGATVKQQMQIYLDVIKNGVRNRGLSRSGADRLVHYYTIVTFSAIDNLCPRHTQKALDFAEEQNAR